LFIIFTVSSTNYIPIFYWIVAGLCSAYIRLCDNLGDKEGSQQFKAGWI